MTFEPGAIVRLKSGGPNMLVLESDADETIVVYCDSGKTPRTDTFVSVTVIEVLAAKQS